MRSRDEMVNATKDPEVPLDADVPNEDEDDVHDDDDDDEEEEDEMDVEPVDDPIANDDEPLGNDDDDVPVDDVPDEPDEPDEEAVVQSDEDPDEESSDGWDPADTDEEEYVHEIDHEGLLPSGGLTKLKGFCTASISYDYMHTVSGVVKDIWKSFAGVRTNNSTKAWEKYVNRDSRCPIDMKEDGKVVKQVNPWELSSDDKNALEEAFKRLSKAIPPREGGGGRLRDVLRKGKKTKSHTWAMLAGPIGMYALMSLQDMPEEVNEAYIEVLRVCHLLGSKSFMSSDLDKLDLVVAEAVAKAEFWLPCSELDIKFHNLLHMVDKIRVSGPAHTTSMWVYESMWGTFARFCRKRDAPEVNSLRRIDEQETLYRTAHQHPWLFQDKPVLQEKETQYWFPRSRYENKDKLSISFVTHPRRLKLVNMNNYEKRGLHHVLLDSFPQYKQKWESYMVSIGGRRAPNLEAFAKRLTDFLAQAGWNTSQLEYKWNVCSEVQISSTEGHPFRATFKVGSWVVTFKKPLQAVNRRRNRVNTSVETPGSCVWVGQVTHLFSHVLAPGMGPPRALLRVRQWYESYKRTEKESWDAVMKLQVVKPVPVEEFSHQDHLVFANEIAPVDGVMVLPHPNLGHLQVVLHKRIDFLECAGFEYEFNNPKPLKQILTWMKQEHVDRQRRARVQDTSD